MRRRSAALLLLASLMAFSAPGRPEEAEELLRPGQPHERTITEGEGHAYRFDAGEGKVVVTVEQQGIDLVVEGQETSGAGNGRWGPEVLLVTGSGSIVVHSKEKSVWPGRYTIRVEPIKEGAQALALMSRAGREAFPGTPEARQRAAASYREALAAWSALGDRRWEAEALTCLAFLEQESSELLPAIGHHEQALALWRELAEPRREAAVLNELGLTRLYSGEIAGAREALEGSLALWKRLGERFDEAETRSNLCFLEQTVGDLSAALACYEEPRAVFREVGVRSQEERILNNVGGIYDLLGEPDAALDHYRQALDLRRALGNRLGEAQTLNNIGVIQRTLGEWQEALRVFGQAREILAPLGDRSQEAGLLNNVGFTYNSLGEPQRALAFLEDALKLRRETGERRGEIIVLNNLGTAWRRLGDLEKALGLHRQALGLATGTGDARQEAVTRLRLAEVLLEQGDPTAALRDLDPALVHFGKSGLRHSEAQALQLRGNALVLAGRPREALPVLQEVLARRRSLRDRPGEAEALRALAAAERAAGLSAEARAHAEAAVDQVEQLRNGFVSPGLRASFLATQRRAYALLIDLLMDRHAANRAGGWDRAALAVSERARARSLLDMLASGGAGRAGKAVPAGLLARRQALRRRLSAKADQQVKQGGGKAEALTREIELLLAELDGVDAEIRRHDPEYAALLEPRPIGLEEIAGLLDPGTLFLEYALGEERSFLWTVGAGGLRSYVLPAQRQIEALAGRVYEDLSTIEAGAVRREDAETLGRLLLEPAWKEIAGAQRLAVVPDAALHVIPFGALPVPEPGGGWDVPGRQPLLSQREVVHLASATTLALQRKRMQGRPPAPKRAAVLADPVFAPAQGGERAGLLPRFERLPASRREAEEIAGLAPAGQVWTALDLAASRETVLSGELRAYRILHFATHGIADTRNPEMSGLVLSLVDAAGRPREGFLSLSDIYELDLAADLVVLSGCRTGLGKEVRGEGLMGLTRGFLYAGVPRVVGGLWPVQDRAAAELMTRFYRGMWRDGLSPAAALREAQLSLRRDPRYRHSYSWAGYVLQGDWR